MSDGRVTILKDELAAFDRGMVVSYGELVRAFSRLNEVYQDQHVIDEMYDSQNPRDLPGGADYPDFFASWIFREVQSDRMRKIQT